MNKKTFLELWNGCKIKRKTPINYETISIENRGAAVERLSSTIRFSALLNKNIIKTSQNDSEGWIFISFIFLHIWFHSLIYKCHSFDKDFYMIFSVGPSSNQISCNHFTKRKIKQTKKRKKKLEEVSKSKTPLTKEKTTIERRKFGTRSLDLGALECMQATLKLISDNSIN